MIVTQRIRLVLFLLPVVLTIARAQSSADWESRFREIPSAEKQREYMERLTARPHHLGSPYGRENAQWMLATFREWGLDATIETFNVLFPSPKERIVELVAPTRFRASLVEPPVPGDPTSSQQDEQLPTYNAYSIDGDVTAPLVYVNYGIPADYEQLERFGVSVKGCIVIARYGASWRGIKPKVAAEHGAVGCIIYSDPRDDGYFQGDVFPKGPYRNADGVQRGSVMDMPLYPGDPLTPGVGATADARRLPLSEVQTFTRIPVLPISYGDAKPLLEALEGPVAPESWRGALPLTYHIGPGPATVRLKVLSSWDRKDIYNVVVKIPGSTYPDEWILRGNHHDAWVNGADDPTSGMVAMMEELRAFSELLKQGWRPKRTIVYCAWDAEEQGLIGSVEWAENHAEELRKKAVIYINSDSNGRGFLSMAGSHSLEKFINAVARDITDPEKKISVWERAKARRIVNARSAEDRKEIREREDLRIGALGSGSDYTAFLDHLGIASLNLSYGGEEGDGIYHSIYDDFFWFTTFSDSDFRYGRALSQTAGTAVLRLADADLLPFGFVNLAETVQRYVEELKRLLKSTRDEITERNRQIAEGVFFAVDNPRKPTVPPGIEEVPPELDFGPLDKAADALMQSAERYEKASQAVSGSASSLSAGRLREINDKLIQSERLLSDASGLPGRSWFRHLLYAPGFYTGYGVKTIPGVREGIEQKRWKEAQGEIGRVAGALANLARHIDLATDHLSGK